MFPFQVASGRRVINLSNILEFVTGATEEPLLGFSIKPSIKFVELPVVDEVIVYIYFKKKLYCQKALSDSAT